MSYIVVSHQTIMSQVYVIQIWINPIQIPRALRLLLIFKHSLSQGCPRYLLEHKSQGYWNKKSVHTSSIIMSTAGNLL